MAAEAGPAPGVRVAGVAHEVAGEAESAIPWELVGPPGTVAVQLRTTVPRVTVGSGLARRPGILAALRAIPGLPGLATSPVGGTFVVGGPAWVGLAAVAVLPSGAMYPIDWLMGALHGWLRGFLAPLGVDLAVGRVEGAWCPGFSDGTVGGRKLIGLGFRVSGGRVACRGMLAVRPLRQPDLGWLRASHALIDLPVEAERCTSLTECTGRTWTASAVLEGLSRTAIGEAAA